jgi:hypothetical protein
MAKIVKAKLGNDAGVIGAAELVKRNLLQGYRAHEHKSTRAQRAST